MARTGLEFIGLTDNGQSMLYNEFLNGSFIGTVKKPFNVGSDIESLTAEDIADILSKLKI